MRKTNIWMSTGLAVLLSGVCTVPLYAKGPAYEETDLAESGTIVGVVRFKGQVPAAKRLDVSASQDQPCHHEPIYNEEMVVADDGGLQWAVASVYKIKHGKPFPKENAQNPVTLDQKGCRFSPHVLVVPARRNLRILNSDGILHNVHTHTNKNRSINRAMPGKVTELDVSFKRSDRIRFSCDVHQWMKAWVVVANHPYYAVTGSDGTFRLENVPVGTHLIEVWHEKLGKQRAEVTVAPDEEAHVEFVFND